MCVGVHVHACVKICIRAHSDPHPHTAAAPVLCMDSGEHGKPADLPWRPGFRADGCTSFRGHGGHRERYGADEEAGLEVR